ncbi:MAG: hypothetical protein K6A23_02365 [Butyrivibrio sp.]|nr:hypothetical protein [Butyrivibrio sp.]
MRVLFDSGVVKEVNAVEVVPMDVGTGQIVGTQVNFNIATGDVVKYIYRDNVDIETSGTRALDFIQKLYTNGFADFSQEPVELL